MTQEKYEKALANAELSFEIASGLLNTWVEAIAKCLNTQQEGFSLEPRVRNCKGCSGRKIIFKAKRKARMEETQEQLEERLRTIRDKFEGRLTRRINMTREAITFLEESKGHMCGGCAERRLHLLKKKLTELEQRKQAL